MPMSVSYKLSLKLTELTVKTRIAFAVRKGKSPEECQDEVDATFNHFPDRFKGKKPTP